ncbi:hypothetical protein P692DRAFT_20871018 [Suillus brevipes Sb2]|nr:hypothetical protein P692DRAFT_20871018 [Suillus brevipes Sb2]
MSKQKSTFEKTIYGWTALDQHRLRRKGAKSPQCNTNMYQHSVTLQAKLAISALYHNLIDATLGPHNV